MSNVQRYLRRAVKRVAPDLALKVKAVVLGDGVEFSVLKDYEFVPDETERPRLNLIIPSLSLAGAYGGVLTGIDYFFSLCNLLRVSRDLDIRIVSEKRINAEDNVLSRFSTPDSLSTIALEAHDNKLPTRKKDVFVTFNWWTALNLRNLKQQQNDHFNSHQLPRIALIQEYEPYFYPFSSTQLLTIEAFNYDGLFWGVFNSRQLYDFYKLLGNRVDDAFIFEPKMNAELKACFEDLVTFQKTKIAIIYGRPTIERNAFSIIRSSLEIWANKFGARHTDWRFVSAGAEHKPISLANGIRLEAAGKLSLKKYAELLSEASMGISLMCSPHPSYPPLEMAHFGIRVITNKYASKDLSAVHPNIISADSVVPEELADQIETEIQHLETDPGTGVNNIDRNCDYIQNQSYDDIDRLSALLAKMFE